eukprot:1972816-Prymnesium_polylepis.1
MHLEGGHSAPARPATTGGPGGRRAGAPEHLSPLLHDRQRHLVRAGKGARAFELRHGMRGVLAGSSARVAPPAAARTAVSA